jgi:hypothetical protein
MKAGYPINHIPRLQSQQPGEKNHEMPWTRYHVLETGRHF